MTKEPAPDQIEQIADAIAKGNKIEAIRLYRKASGCDLKDSKEFIEKLTVELRDKDPARFAKAAAGNGCLGVLLLLVVLPTCCLLLK